MNPSTYRRLATIRPAALGGMVKTLLRIKRRVVKTPQGSFYLDPLTNLGFTILEDGEFEPMVTKAIRTFLTPSSTFVDLGAHEGYHTITASKLCARVVAIEPQTRLQEVIKRNIQLNEVTNVTVEQVAISDRVGSSTLFLYPATNTGASGLSPQLRYPTQTEIVQTTTLSALFQSHAITQCDLLKVDIEGGEYDAIMGSPNLFSSRRIKAMIIEPSERILINQGKPFSKVTWFLGACGYVPDEQFLSGGDRQVWKLPT